MRALSTALQVDEITADEAVIAPSHFASAARVGRRLAWASTGIRTTTEVDNTFNRAARTAASPGAAEACGEQRQPEARVFRSEQHRSQDQAGRSRGQRVPDLTHPHRATLMSILENLCTVADFVRQTFRLPVFCSKISWIRRCFKISHPSAKFLSCRHTTKLHDEAQVVPQLVRTSN